MNTKIKLTHEGQEYILEFNRMTIKMLEGTGFKLEEFLDKPMTNIELAFTAAFVKNHPNTKQNVIDNIYAECKNKNALIATLSKMINECYESLLVEPKDDDSGKIQWEIVDTTPIKTKKEKVENQE